MSARPLRVALLGCGVVGSQVVRLLDEQAADLTHASAPRSNSPASRCAGQPGTPTSRSTCSPPTPAASSAATTSTSWSR